MSPTKFESYWFCDKTQWLGVLNKTLEEWSQMKKRFKDLAHG
jgi:hypothetical protein